MRQIGPSLIRTIVPWIVGMLVGALAERGFDLPDGVADEVVTVLISGVYYGAVRVAETRLAPVWGWLLGSPKQPVYVTPGTGQPLIARHFYGSKSDAAHHDGT